MIYFEDNLASVGFDKDLDATFMIFKESVSSDEFIDIHRKVVEMLLEMDSSSGKHFVDTYPMKTVSLEGQKWVAEHVVPLIHEKGQREVAQIALVLSNDVFGQFAVKNITKKTDGISEVHFFNTAEEAKTWLKKI